MEYHRKKNKTNELKPFFAHFLGFGEEAHAIFPLDLQQKLHLIVGTNRGRCLLFSVDSLKQLALLHEDAEKRQIVAIGLWPFAGEGTNAEHSVIMEESVKEQNKEAEPCCSSSDNDGLLLWFHFRCSSIALFKVLRLPSSPSHSHQNGRMFTFYPIRELNTGHYGFCRAVSDPIRKLFFIPDHEDLSTTVRIRYRMGGEKVFVFGEEFMSRSWAKKRKENILGEKAMFKGTLMGLEVLAGGDRLLLAFEDSTICVFDLRTKEVVDALKHPKHPELIGWSVVPVLRIDQALIAVSVVGQVYLLSYSSTKGGGREAEDPPLKAESKVKKCKRDEECTAIALCCDGADSEDRAGRLLALGFKTGVIEIYSIHSVPSSSPISTTDVLGWNIVLLSMCANFHKGPIRVLSWNAPNNELPAAECSSRKSLILFAADSHLSYFTWNV